MTLELSVSFYKVIIQTQRKKERNKKEKRRERELKTKRGKGDEASRCSIFLMNVCLETFFFLKKRRGLKNCGVSIKMPFEAMALKRPINNFMA